MLVLVGYALILLCSILSVVFIIYPPPSPAPPHHSSAPRFSSSTPPLWQKQVSQPMPIQVEQQVPQICRWMPFTRPAPSPIILFTTTPPAAHVKEFWNREVVCWGPLLMRSKQTPHEFWLSYLPQSYVSTSWCYWRIHMTHRIQVCDAEAWQADAFDNAILKEEE